LLRVVLGVGISTHGAQKLFGWFGGGGPKGTAGFMGPMLRFRAPLAMAVLAGLGEFGGGLLVALGFLTPLGCFALVNVMCVAILTVHISKGYFVGNGGYEFNLLILAAATAIAMTGPGRFSIDRALHVDDNWSGLWWGVGVLVAGVAVAALTLTVLRRRDTA
jgi:putative oxidoreductase